MSRLFLCIAFAFTACARTEAPPEIWKEFSGERALADVQALVNCGPRPPDSPAIARAREYIIKELRAADWRVTEQEFTDQTPRGPAKFVNLIATFSRNAEANKAPLFLLCSHYDTKTFDTSNFVGANDGGSSNGVLLEMARVLAKHPKLANRVRLVFFDGEEAYVSFTETDGLYGSRYFANQATKDGSAKQFRGGILFDMVGDKNLTITLSPDSPREMTRDIFAAADALKVRKHFTYADNGIMDDHTPLNAAGITTIDLIDFDYPSWHTPADTMDKISAESLQIVGSVAARYLAKVALK